MAAFQVCLSKSYMNPLTDLLSSTPAVTSTKSSDIGLRSTRFHVPDDDEIDSSSESSREASVEILNSCVRAYSVPSSEGSVITSDDDEDQPILKRIQFSQPITNSGVAAAQPANTAGTTPHHALEIESETPSSKEPELLRSSETESFGSSSIKVNGSGTSPLYPAEDVEAHEKVVLSSDSEDELPEVLSSKKTQVPSATHVLTSSSIRTTDSQYLAGDSPFVGREANHIMIDQGMSKNNENPEKSMTETPFTKPQLQMDVSPLIKPTRKPLHELESMDGEDMEYPSLYYHVNHPSTLASYNLTSNYCGGSSLAPGVLHYLPAKSIPENSQTTSMNGNDCSHPMASCKTTIGNNEKDSPHKASVVRRPPSPSDAALVKKAKFIDQRSFWPVMEQSQGQSLIDTPSEYETQFNETHEIGEAGPNHSHYINGGRYYVGCDSSPWAFTHAQPVDRSQIHGSTAEPDALSLSENASSKSAAQGHPLEPALFPPCNQNSYVEDCAPLIPNVDPNSSIFDMHHHQPKENGSHSSRLNISDILHPQLESTRNLKRKADEISVDDAEAVPCILPSESSQDVLTDAQPRDITSAEETNLLEDSSNIPVQDEISIQQPSVSGSLEPPRKKVKTSVATAIGIGKFVSGVCFGVMGVFAAFIATIPLSVREEAMQELVSST